MKILVFAKCDPRVMQFVADSTNETWTIVTSFEANLQDWKDCAPKCKLVLFKDLKQFPATNVVMDCPITSLESVELGKISNFVVVSQNAKIVDVCSGPFTDICICSNAKSASAFYETLTGKPLEKSNKQLFIHIDPASLAISQPKSEVKKSRGAELNVQFTSLVPFEQLSAELKLMCTTPLISNMLIDYEIGDTQNKQAHATFHVRKKRLDLFGILLLNMLRALKERELVEVACLYV
jgi:hypothetical protein